MNGSFPASLQTALAFLYVEKNAKEGMTPSEIYDMYYKAFDEIRKKEDSLKEIRASR